MLNHQIKGVLFDFDGTLTKPGAIDFNLVRKTLGCPLDMPVLEFIEQMATAKEKQNAHALLEDFEIKAARASIPHDGAETLVQKLIRHGLPVGIITRNSLRCLEIAFQNFSKVALTDFDPVLTRDAPLAPKPSGEGICFCAGKWGLKPAEVLMVGDFMLDVQAGRNAGATTAFLDNAIETAFPKLDGDFNIHHLSQLDDIIGLNTN